MPQPQTAPEATLERASRWAGALALFDALPRQSLDSALEGSGHSVDMSGRASKQTAKNPRSPNSTPYKLLNSKP